MEQHGSAEWTEWELRMEVGRLRAEVAKARRDGAEAMQKRCAKACRTVATLDTLSEVRPALYLEGRHRGAILCAAAIRALPLDAGGE